MRVVRLFDRYGVVDVMCAAPARLVTGRALVAVQADPWLGEAGADVGADTADRPALAERGGMTATGPRDPRTRRPAGTDRARARGRTSRAFEAQLRSSGYCARPIRLQGHDRDLRRARPPARVVDQEPSPTACSARRAGTAARRSARRARSATAATRTS